MGTEVEWGGDGGRVSVSDMWPQVVVMKQFGRFHESGSRFGPEPCCHRPRQEIHDAKHR